MMNDLVLSDATLNFQDLTKLLKKIDVQSELNKCSQDFLIFLKNNIFQLLKISFSTSIPIDPIFPRTFRAILSFKSQKIDQVMNSDNDILDFILKYSQSDQETIKTTNARYIQLLRKLILDSNFDYISKIEESTLFMQSLIQNIKYLSFYEFLKDFIGTNGSNFFNFFQSSSLSSLLFSYLWLLDGNEVKYLNLLDILLNSIGTDSSLDAASDILFSQFFLEANVQHLIELAISSSGSLVSVYAFQLLLSIFSYASNLQPEIQTDSKSEVVFKNVIQIMNKSYPSICTFISHDGAFLPSHQAAIAYLISILEFEFCHEAIHSPLSLQDNEIQVSNLRDSCTLFHVIPSPHPENLPKSNTTSSSSESCSNDNISLSEINKQNYLPENSSNKKEIDSLHSQTSQSIQKEHTFEAESIASYSFPNQQSFLKESCEEDMISLIDSRYGINQKDKNFDESLMNQPIFLAETKKINKNTSCSTTHDNLLNHGASSCDNYKKDLISELLPQKSSSQHKQKKSLFLNSMTELMSSHQVSIPKEIKISIAFNMSMPALLPLAQVSSNQPSNLITAFPERINFDQVKQIKSSNSSSNVPQISPLCESKLNASSKASSSYSESSSETEEESIEPHLQRHRSNDSLNEIESENIKILESIPHEDKNKTMEQNIPIFENSPSSGKVEVLEHNFHNKSNSLDDSWKNLPPKIPKCISQNIADKIDQLNHNHTPRKTLTLLELANQVSVKNDDLPGMPLYRTNSVPSNLFIGGNNLKSLINPVHETSVSNCLFTDLYTEHQINEQTKITVSAPQTPLPELLPSSDCFSIAEEPEPNEEEEFVIERPHDFNIHPIANAVNVLSKKIFENPLNSFLHNSLLDLLKGLIEGTDLFPEVIAMSGIIEQIETIIKQIGSSFPKNTIYWGQIHEIVGLIISQNESLDNLENDEAWKTVVQHYEEIEKIMKTPYGGPVDNLITPDLNQDLI